MRRDTRVLESFRIMDYSLLIGIHNLDQVSELLLQIRMHTNCNYVIVGGEGGGRGERQQPLQILGGGGRRGGAERVSEEGGGAAAGGGLDGEEAAVGALDGDGGDPGAVRPNRQRRPPTVSLSPVQIYITLLCKLFSCCS